MIRVLAILALIAAALPAQARSRVAACVARRGHWPSTVAAVLPAAGPTERALLLGSDGHDPEEWIALHAALRLVSCWSTTVGDGERDWGIVQQNHGRARGRLRAVVALQSPSHVVAPILALPALAARTRAAARRWGWAWAWEALARGFSFDLDQTVVRPCTTDPGESPLEGEDLAVVESWLLLAILRGRGATARRWAVDGSGDRDGTWGRLLQEIPEDLRDADGGFTRVRAALAHSWEGLHAAVLPVVTEIAALPPGRRLRQAFWALAGPAWHDTLTEPRAGFPTFVRHAGAWVHGSETEGEVPEGAEE